MSRWRVSEMGNYADDEIRYLKQRLDLACEVIDVLLGISDIAVHTLVTPAYRDVMQRWADDSR